MSAGTAVSADFLPGVTISPQPFAVTLVRTAKEIVMLKFLGGAVGFVFIVGLVVIVGLLMLIF